jgi:hypothetical protein
VFKGYISPEQQLEKIKSHFGKIRRRVDEKIFLKTDLSLIYKLRFDPKIPPEYIVASLSKYPEIVYAEPNRKLHMTANLNDPFFLDPNPPAPERNLPLNNGGWNPTLRDNSYLDYQWNLKKLSFPQALDYASPSAQPIVAVLDSGADYNHPDLQGALWENEGEKGIDGQNRDKKTNGLDDDNNGYIDDWRGWNAVDFWVDTCGWGCFEHTPADNDPIDKPRDHNLSQNYGGGGRRKGVI